MPGRVRYLAVLALVTLVVEPCFAQDASTQPFQNPDPDASLKAGANSFAEGQARALIESKGFSQVSGLVNHSDGIWRGRAMKDNRPMEVSVDYRGHVAAQ